MTLTWLPVVLNAQNALTYATNNGVVIVTGYVGARSSVTNVVIPATVGGYLVVGIGNYAFSSYISLTNVAIPNSVTSLGNDAFYHCTSLTNLIFLGNAPSLGEDAFFGVPGTVYYYYGTSGWGATCGGLPTVMLYPPPQIKANSAGLKPGGFGFTLTGLVNQLVVVEASTNLVNWQPIWTNTLSGPAVDFVAPQWTNHPRRFYRAR